MLSIIFRCTERINLCFGKTNVTVSVYSKASGNLIQSFTVKVQVKKNATDDSFVVNWGEIVEGAKLGVNSEYTVTMPRVDANGKWLDTDKRDLEANDESVVITATNKYKTAYTVKFTKAGEFTLTASAYQSVLYPLTLLKDSVTVKAGYTALAVSQYSLREATVTFDTNVAGLDVSNFTAYYMLDGVKCPTLTTEVVPIDENTVKVTFFSNFIYGREYFVEYDGETVDSFKAITVDANSVQSIELPAQNVIAGKEDVLLKFKLIGPDGIILATKHEEMVPELDGVFNFTCAEEDRVTMFLDAPSGEIYFANVGDKVTVKVEYSWYNDLVDKKVEGSGVVTSVKDTDWTLTDAKLAITDANAGSFKDGASSDVARFAQGDAVILQGKFVYNKDYNQATYGINYEYDSTNNDGSHPDDPANLDGKKKYEIFSSDEKIVMTQQDFNNGVILVANNTGSCTLLVYEVVEDENGKATRGNLVATKPVTVVAARTADTLKVTTEGNKNTLNKGWEGDNITFVASLYDQYGDLLNGRYYYTKDANGVINGITEDLVKFKDAKATTAKDGTTVAVGSLDKTSYKYLWYKNGSVATLNSTSIYVKPNVTLKKTAISITFEGYFNGQDFNSKKCSANIYLVNEADATKQTLTLSGSELKTTINPESWNAAEIATINVGLAGSTKSGYSAAPDAITFYNEYEGNSITSKDTVSGSAMENKYIFTVKKDGVAVKDPARVTSINGDTKYSEVASGEAINFVGNTFTNLTVNPTDDGNQLYKLQSGKYTIEAYQGVYNEKNNVVTFKPIGSASFTVKDETKAPTIKQIKDNIAASTVADAFRVGWTGEWDTKYVTGTTYAVTESTINANGDQDSVYVSTADVTVMTNIKDVTGPVYWTFKSQPVKALLWKTTVKQLDGQDIR